LYKSLFDALVFLALLAMVVFALKISGIIEPDTGQFSAADGDSLRMGKDNYRLHGIDAPELHQHCASAAGEDYACGLEARRALASLINGKELKCSTVDWDRYGRNVALCRAGSLDINREMVRLGWAVCYRRHSLAYVKEEAEARQARRGIWQGSFDYPEDWRAEHRPPPVRGGVMLSD
jgi:endonuclease YncB( thermonuclease family)